MKKKHLGFQKMLEYSWVAVRQMAFQEVSFMSYVVCLLVSYCSLMFLSKFCSTLKNRFNFAKYFIHLHEITRLVTRWSDGFRQEGLELQLTEVQGSNMKGDGYLYQDPLPDAMAVICKARFIFWIVPRAYRICGGTLSLGVKDTWAWNWLFTLIWPVSSTP
jgi:hypothetical protein